MNYLSIASAHQPIHHPLVLLPRVPPSDEFQIIETLLQQFLPLREFRQIDRSISGYYLIRITNRALPGRLCEFARRFSPDDRVDSNYALITQFYRAIYISRAAKKRQRQVA